MGGRSISLTISIFVISLSFPQHSGYTEYVMFQDWIPRNATQYWLSVLALIALSIVYEGLIALSALLESRWIQRDKAAACFPYKLRSSNNKISHGNANSGENGFASSSSSSVNGLYVASIRSILKFVSSTLGYAIMLVTMTFNWGLFFGVMIGLTIGTFLFSGLIRRAGIESKGAFDGSAATSATACC